MVAVAEEGEWVAVAAVAVAKADRSHFLFWESASQPATAFASSLDDGRQKTYELEIFQQKTHDTMLYYG